MRIATKALRRSASCSEALRTVIVKVADVECDAASMTVHVTVVAPTAKRVPDAGAQVSDAGLTSSVATAMNETIAPCEVVAFVVAAAGRVSDGAVTSVPALAPAAESSAIARSPNQTGATTAPTFPSTCPPLARDTARARGTGGA